MVAMRRFRVAVLMLAGVSLPLLSIAAQADKIKNPIAVFAGLDKITGRIIAFEAAVDETVQFGSLQLTARVCYSRPEYDNPQTTSFVEVDEVSGDNKYRRLFGGWMFASSPGLNAIEHPVYDIWLTECKGGTEIIKTPPELEENPTEPPESRKGTKPVTNAPGTNAGNVRNVPPQAPGAANAPLRLGNNPAPAPQPTPRAPPQQRYFPTNPENPRGQ
jgi:hypothetical protein